MWLPVLIVLLKKLREYINWKELSIITRKTTVLYIFIFLINISSTDVAEIASMDITKHV